LTTVNPTRSRSDCPPSPAGQRKSTGEKLAPRSRSDCPPSPAVRRRSNPKDRGTPGRATPRRKIKFVKKQERDEGDTDQVVHL
jgi:hypothetical protein